MTGVKDDFKIIWGGGRGKYFCFCFVLLLLLFLNTNGGVGSQEIMSFILAMAEGS